MNKNDHFQNIIPAIAENKFKPEALQILVLSCHLEIAAAQPTLVPTAQSAALQMNF